MEKFKKFNFAQLLNARLRSGSQSGENFPIRQKGLDPTGSATLTRSVCSKYFRWTDLRVDLLHDLAKVSCGERLDVVGAAVAEILLVHLVLGQGHLQGEGGGTLSTIVAGQARDTDPVRSKPF